MNYKFSNLIWLESFSIWICNWRISDSLWLRSVWKRWEYSRLIKSQKKLKVTCTTSESWTVMFSLSRCSAYALCCSTSACDFWSCSVSIAMCASACFSSSRDCTTTWVISAWDTVRHSAATSGNYLTIFCSNAETSSEWIFESSVACSFCALEDLFENCIYRYISTNFPRCAFASSTSLRRISRSILTSRIWCWRISARLLALLSSVCSSATLAVLALWRH